MNLEYVFIEFEIETECNDIQKILDSASSLCRLFGFRYYISDRRDTYACFEIAYPRYHFLEADYSNIVKTFAVLNNCKYLRSYVSSD
jgi:hypothetical protein